MLTARPDFVCSRRPSAWRSIAAALALLLSLMAGGASAHAAQTLRPAPTRHIPDLVATAKPLGRMAATPKMTVEFVLPLRNQAQLTDELNRIADPKDPLYGKYMTSQEFADAYGPSPADVSAVAKFAAGKGLSIKDISGNRTLVKVTGPSTAIETAFGVHLNNYQAAGGRVFFAPDREPLFPASIAARIIGVTGLDNAKVYKPSSQRIPKHPTLSNLPAYAQPLGDKQPQDVIGTGPTIGGYSTLGPNDVRSIYGIPAVSSPGLGQTLAVFELDGYTPGDITAYDNYYYPSLTAVPLQNVLVDGYDGSAGSGTGEVTLDIEMMVALCPYATKIICYEAPNTTTGDEEEYSKIASDNLASIISSSWGGTEYGTSPDAQATSENQSFQQMARQGQSFFIASGDSGAYANQDSTTAGTLSVQDPGSQPYATSVGGTLMNDSSSEGYVSESAWSAPSDTNRGLSGTGSGGGISAWWPIPSYQSGFANASNLGSTTQRNVPDVSLFGDFDEGYYSIYLSGDNGFSGSNGTSAAAPLWAAYVALVNQGRASHGAAKIGFINPAVYGLAKNTTTYNNDFHDINDGTTNLYYPAVTGYDLATGLGSPKGTALYNDLVAYGTTSAPAITSFTPTSGPVGTSVTITGTNFTGATSVKFHGTATTSYTVNSATSITATVPTGATTGTISVTTSGGTATSTASFTVNATSGASISGQVFFDHNGNGTQDSGDTGLSGWTVYVDSNGNGTFDAGEPSAVTNAGGNYTISGLTAGTYNVDLVGQSGYHESLPDVQYSGWSVTLTTGQTYTGLNYGETQTAALYGYVYNDANANGVFDSGEATLTGWTVFLDENGSGQPNGTNPTTTSSSTGYFEFTGLAAGATYTMRVVLQSGYRITQPGSGGYYVSSNVASGFAGYGPFGVTTSGVTSAPTITSFSPTSGPVGTSVTITGTNFTGATSVKFHGTAATFTVNSATQITATVATGTTTGTITVTTAAGTGTSSASFTVTTTSGAPTITGFTPTSGPVGTTIVLTGTNFTGTTVVGFTGAHAAFTVNSATQITATVPSGAQTGTIAVGTPSGTAHSATSFTVTTVAAPTITSFTPTSGPVGTSVVITGTSFTGATSVKFHGTAATSYTVNSATQVTATVAAGTTTGTITVTTSAGTATSSASFTVTTTSGPPTITSFTPTSGPVGTSVVITGTNFTGATVVGFTGAHASFTVNSATQITATVPSSATTGTIAVATPAGTAKSAASFTVTTGSGVTLAGFAASSNTVPTGGGFALAAVLSAAAPAGGANVTLTLNGAAQSPITVAAGQDTGTTSYTAGSSAGTDTFVASYGGVSQTVVVTIVAAPTITSFTPTSGPVGTSVTITGTNLTGASSVTFHGTAATAYTVNTATSITATVPTGATTGTVAVTTPGGTATSSAGFTVTTTSGPPTITSFTPTSGPVGTVVVITGTNFASTTGVKFNGVAASGSITSNTQLTVTVPTGATTGRITVTTSAGTATSSASFTVTTTGVTISSFSPSSGPAGTSVVITGTGFTGATSVTFNGKAATFTVNSATSITAVVPAGATSGAVGVTAPAGSAMSSASYTVTF